MHLPPLVVVEYKVVLKSACPWAVGLNGLSAEWAVEPYFSPLFETLTVEVVVTARPIVAMHIQADATLRCFRIWRSVRVCRRAYKSIEPPPQPPREGGEGTDSKGGTGQKLLVPKALQESKSDFVDAAKEVVHGHRHHSSHETTVKGRAVPAVALENEKT